ncbi:hypothetical protein QAD02_015632 [Eretmocerus hayati]|uniref:Uncharacterized protein n=1 Tax=Eretmocerus hayati TaxID=131215 RepID=A0ACC2PDL5_9HYME|nr:hypothetical protein QAD02_015632 [Eretmocerus hayati]
MELVLSPGSESGPDGPGSGPFRNEDVREWSRLDGVTGMLERARVETDRWRADTQDARHSYGKMVDSRERNSADGSLVQKARRQVEIFQSQGNSGRAFEVIRASQWSSSRATDCTTFNIPITKSDENGCIDAVKSITNGITNGSSNGNGILNGSLSNSGSGSNSSAEASPRLGNGSSWRNQNRLIMHHQDRGTAGHDLEQLSQICRRLHDEAISQHNRLWHLSGGTSATNPLSLSEQLSALQNDDYKCNGSVQESQNSYTNRNSMSTLIPRSSSNEDLSHRSNSGTNLKDTNEGISRFARDSKSRRSLRAPSLSSSSSNSDHQPQKPIVRPIAVIRSELVAERAKRFEPESNGNSKVQDCVSSSNQNGSSPSPSRSRVNGFVGSFTPIANNDFVKNDPKHPSKMALMQQQQANPTTAKIANTKQPPDSNGTSAAIALSNGSPISSKKIGEPHRTVVHLRITPSPSAENGCSVVGPAKTNGEVERGTVTTDSSKVQNNKDEAQTQQQQQVANNKPVKRVEFCKTEIHFAPDSGKVNIVETDEKPPPTNKFRRRKRNANNHQAKHAAGSNLSANPHKANMPLVHFGDTSFEKYFFGGQGKTASHHDQTSSNSVNTGKKHNSDDGDLNFVIRPKMENGLHKSGEIDRWPNPLDNRLFRPSHNGIAIETNGNGIKDDVSSTEIRPDHNKSRGAHTTTVKILNDQNNALHKLAQDKPLNEDIKHASPKPMPRTLKKQQDSLEKEAINNKPATKFIEHTSNKPDSQASTTSTKLETAPNTKRNDLSDVTDQAKISKSETVTSKKTNAISNHDDEGEEGIPTYENIFDSVGVYENCNLAKSRRSNEAQNHRNNIPTPAQRRRLPSASKQIQQQQQQQQVANVNGGSVDESKRSVSRSSGGSRDSSIGKTRPTAANRHQQPTAASRRKVVLVKTNGSESNCQRTGTPSSEKNRATEVTRTKKKPVEVVYQTAVYNMKNEKLSKPSRGKETKGPRLINEFICGSKVKRPSDKKTVKTATATQNTGKRKEVPVAVSRLFHRVGSNWPLMREVRASCKDASSIDCVDCHFWSEHKNLYLKKIGIAPIDINKTDKPFRSCST